MNFMEILKELNNGKTVKRKTWAFTVKLDGGVSLISGWEDKTEYKSFDIKDYEATDWEIVEDKKERERAIREIQKINQEIKAKSEMIETLEKEFGKVELAPLLEDKKTLSDFIFHDNGVAKFDEPMDYIKIEKIKQFIKVNKDHIKTTLMYL